jgi:gluconolactonase
MNSTIPAGFQRRVLASGLDHPEGICWDPTRGCLWAGGEAGQIYRIELDGSLTIHTTIDGGALLGIALDLTGDRYVCDPGNHQVWRVDSAGEATAYGSRIEFPNYPAFGPDGRLFVSDSGSVGDATGRLYAIAPDGSTMECSPRPLAYPNGLAAGPDKLWIVESTAPCVSALRYDGGGCEVVIELDRCFPDGLALDADGGLLISCYQPNQLWRWSEADGLVKLFDDWSGEFILSPTNIAFFGAGLEHLALASLCGHDIVAITLPYTGAPVLYP